jgi:hypothetical protein
MNKYFSWNFLHLYTPLVPKWLFKLCFRTNWAKTQYNTLIYMCLIPFKISYKCVLFIPFLYEIGFWTKSYESCNFELFLYEVKNLIFKYLFFENRFSYDCTIYLLIFNRSFLKIKKNIKKKNIIRVYGWFWIVLVGCLCSTSGRFFTDIGFTFFGHLNRYRILFFLNYKCRKIA